MVTRFPLGLVLNLALLLLSLISGISLDLSGAEVPPLWVGIILITGSTAVGVGLVRGGDFHNRGALSPPPSLLKFSLIWHTPPLQCLFESWLCGSAGLIGTA